MSSPFATFSLRHGYVLLPLLLFEGLLSCRMRLIVHTRTYTPIHAICSFPFSHYLTARRETVKATTSQLPTQNTQKKKGGLSQLRCSSALSGSAHTWCRATSFRVSPAVYSVSIVPTLMVCP